MLSRGHKPTSLVKGWNKHLQKYCNDRITNYSKLRQWFRRMLCWAIHNPLMHQKQKNSSQNMKSSQKTDQFHKKSSSFLLHNPQNNSTTKTKLKTKTQVLPPPFRKKLPSVLIHHSKNISSTIPKLNPTTLFPYANTTNKHGPLVLYPSKTVHQDGMLEINQEEPSQISQLQQLYPLQQMRKTQTFSKTKV